MQGPVLRGIIRSERWRTVSASDASGLGDPAVAQGRSGEMFGNDRRLTVYRPNAREGRAAGRLDRLAVERCRRLFHFVARAPIAVPKRGFRGTARGPPGCTSLRSVAPAPRPLAESASVGPNPDGSVGTRAAPALPQPVNRHPIGEPAVPAGTMPGLGILGLARSQRPEGRAQCH